MVDGRLQFQDEGVASLLDEDIKELLVEAFKEELKVRATVPPARGGKSGRFREFNSQKIFSKTRFDRKYLGKYHDIRSFANQNSSVMLNSSRQLKKMPFSIVFILSLRLKPCQNLEKLAENI